MRIPPNRPAELSTRSFCCSVLLLAVWGSGGVRGESRSAPVSPIPAWELGQTIAISHDGQVPDAALYALGRIPVGLLIQPPPASSEGRAAARADPSAASSSATVDPNLQQTGCQGCSSGLVGSTLGPVAPVPAAPLDTPPACGCANCCCVPGRYCCSPCDADSALGRAGCALYECICCPDPCYEGRWTPIADAGFFVDSPRPITQMGVRWDSGLNVIFPDRSEYFWPRADGRGKGPSPTPPFKGELGVKYNDLDMYTEAATGLVGVFVEYPYRSLDPQLAPHAAGFEDLQIGTKTLLYDCELLQLSFEFRTYIPTGNFHKGLGTGHTSLEPSLLLGIKLAPDMYLETQLAEWIPIGGDPVYEGSILRYNMSLNQVVYRFLPDVPLIGTAELNTLSFQAGKYTDPLIGPYQKSSDETYVSAGPGLRLFICNKVDFGIAAEFSLTERHFADQLYRAEARFRF